VLPIGRAKAAAQDKIKTLKPDLNIFIEPPVEMYLLGCSLNAFLFPTIVRRRHQKTTTPKCNRSVNGTMYGPNLAQNPVGLSSFGESSRIANYCLSAVTFLRISSANAESFMDSRLMSTLASAPSIAAAARALAVVRSDFMFGFVSGPSFATR